MPDYRRATQPGGTYFFTLVTYHRQPLFDDARNIDRLRASVLTVMNDPPFEFLATRIGRMKVLFTKSLHADGGRCPTCVYLPTPSPSRIKHRDADVWQRRFWEHLIRDEEDLRRHLDYIHYNPVKHGLTNCPHGWTASSFQRWVAKGCYEKNWCCPCIGDTFRPPDFTWACEEME